MLAKCSSLSLCLLLSVIICNAHASSISTERRNSNELTTAYVWRTSILGSVGGVNAPSQLDSWVGGTGNWSNPADWSGGLPGTNSDVSITTGNDSVTLDTSASINSLTLGGTTGTSNLTGDGTAHTLTIAGALTVAASGNLSLSADTIVTGASSSNSGRIDLENGSTFQISGDFQNSGSIGAGAGFTFNNSLTVTGTLTNTGVLALGSANGMIEGAGSASLGALVNSGGITLDGGGGSQLGIAGSASNSGSIFTGGSGQTDDNRNSIGIGGTLTNSGTIQLEGADDVIGAGIFINTNRGSLALGNNSEVASFGSLVNNGQISVTFNSTLSVVGNADNLGSISTYNSGDPNDNGTFVTVSGTLTNQGSITLTDHFDSLTIGHLVNSGSLQLQGSSETATIGAVNNSGYLDVETGSSMLVNGDIQNSGEITTNLLYGGRFGSVVLTVTGTFSNAQAGSLVLYGLQDQAVIGTITNAGMIDLENGSKLNVSGNVSNSGQLTTSLYGNGYGTGNTIDINGRLTNNSNGTVSLEAASDIANITSVVNQGSVSIANGARMFVGGSSVAASPQSGFTNTGMVAIAQGGSLTTNSYIQTAGQTTVDGHLTLSGRGVINFAGGSVFGNGGSITGPVVSNAAFNLGDAVMTVGQLAIHGAYTQGLRGSLTVDVAGASSGQYDQLNISSRAILNGLLTVDLLHGFVPQIGNTFDIVNFGSESGTFTMVVGLPINGQEHFVLEYNPTNLTLDVVAGQLTGPGINEVLTTGSQTAGLMQGSSNSGIPSSSTPESGSILLFGSGVVGLFSLFRRKQAALASRAGSR